VPIARGTPKGFIAANALIAAAIFSGGLLWRESAPGQVLLAVGILGALWVGLLVFFFRDPERAPGEGVVSPADGRIQQASTSGQGATVSIFLGVFNVHVVRAPFSGRVSSLAYKPGGRRFAFSKDSHLNERVLLSIAGEGESCSLTLIAGAFADRILPYVEPGATVEKGARIGIIKFGSRVDLEYSSARSLQLRAKMGDTVIAGVTSILVPAADGRAP
jgi:phosphatidylserine decarboxylase